ncbi:ferrous iron transporter B [Seongchinamella sediminis]|uniref:Ferrous iron transport protein B n=1 Tax=Seongchinamella sediminis TaxID=2283635 RepID=A0A3L7DVJ9_9GAMM|nr:ferrous iron transporter B [Seongchinamella sediminis]RLQ20620.1 ferrous iron transporter B [Seongchinamella sediminis]
MSRIILIGSPNSGKSLLFNRLTGLSQKVANFPGITVDVGSGKLQAVPDKVLVDFPGTYSLQAISAEEEVAVDYFERALEDPEVEQVLCLIDATRLEKSLLFTLQVIRDCERNGKPVTVLANMMDILDNHGLQLDVEGLSAALHTPVLPVSARSGKGLDAVTELLAREPDPNRAGRPQLMDTPDVILRGEAHKLAHRFGPKGDVLIRTQNRLDRFFLHSLTGGVSFFLIMYLLFQSIFTWSAPAMDAVEGSLAWLADALVPLLGNQLVQDFTSDALFSGIGAFLVFVPQIFVLTFVIGLLEDSGYMARAALICHKPLRLFGLTGKSFIPMLSGVACAIPGIYAARAIDSPRKRMLTYMAIPLMPCSARLPVYTLLIAAFIPAETTLGGLIGWQGLAMFGIYFFGMMMGLLITGLVSRTREDHYTDLPFVLELPPYRLPGIQPIVRNAWNRSKHFVTKAGKIIFTVTVLIWVLGYFPNYGADLGESWLGQFGHLVEPVFSPLGLDWRYGVAIFTSFAAREVFVGTLGTIFGIEGADENMVPLVEQIQSSDLALGSGLALLVFFAISLQCVSTLAILAKESESRSLTLKMFVGYFLLAYTAAVTVYQVTGLITG